MTLKKPLILLLTVLLTLSVAADSRADISNAAVLFLRIAAGARAAGMGEAFVAIADDATATHWNPAGLGAYPLAQTWVDADIPFEYRPLKQVAALRTGSGDDYESFELWAISDRGLLRYDNRSWSMGEEFNTRSDETVRDKVSAYFSIVDDERLDAIVAKVAEANNGQTMARLEEFVTKVKDAVPEGYSRRGELEANLDSLVALYPQCRLNWNRISEAQDKFREAMKDSSVTELEADRVMFAAERGRSRFIPEQLFIPYAAIIAGVPKAIVSINKGVAIATDDGLLYFNGRRWQIVTESEGLPSNKVNALKASGTGAIVGTDKGVVYFNSVTIDTLEATTMLPEARVTAVGEAGQNKIFAVVEGDLYMYDGSTWSNSFDHTVALDETPASLAAAFAIYGTEEERTTLINRIIELNDNVTSGDQALAAGSRIRLPFVAEIRGDVRDIYVGPQMRLWLGTDHGVLQFTGSEWTLLGYREHAVAEGETLESLAKMRSFRTATERQRYIDQLRLVNGLGDGEEIAAGDTIHVYRDPRASEVYDITAWEFRIYVATSAGMLETDGNTWGRASLRGLGDSHARGVHTQDSEVWFVTSDKIVTIARGHSEFAFMHVNWLPELADDLYYEFIGFTTGVEGWGTFGGNVTFISYGSFQRTGENSPVVIGEFESYDLAITGSYGTSLTSKLKAGISAKLIYSRLADQGAGEERGRGTSTGFAVDFGLMYQWSPRLNLGMAITNIGPKMAYIDAAQSDDLPRNLALGFAYKLLNSEYNRLILTAEMNKLLVGLDDGFSNELKEMVFNGGAEFMYLNLFAVRAGYIYDQEGSVKTVTFGAGLSPLDWLKADFAYIPNNEDVALANTLRISLAVAL